MTIVKWIGIGIGAVILIVGALLYSHYRRKLQDLDGFEGFEREKDNETSPGDNSEPSPDDE